MSAPFAQRRGETRLRRPSVGGAPPLRERRRDPRDTEPISVETRLFVWQRDGGQCRNCGSRQDLHFDHVIPRSWGGASTVDNVQVLCRGCNLKKGASLVDGRHN